MKKSGLEWEELSGIDPNPRISTVRQGAALCKEKQIDVLLAVGGGSTLDATKWMAVGACTERDPWDFLKDRDYSGGKGAPGNFCADDCGNRFGNGWRRRHYQSGNQ